MNRRFLKQLSYGSGFLGFWLIIGLGVYLLFFRVPPSCHDNRRNQGEADVDCGGPCAAVCIPKNLSGIEIIDGVQVLLPDNRHAVITAELHNPNASFAARSFDYEFVLSDGQGATSSISGFTYLYADETRHVASFQEGPAAADFAQYPYREIKITNVEWAPAEEFAQPNLAIRDRRDVSENGQIKIEGTVTNNDAVAMNDIQVVAIFPGPTGAAAGVSRTSVGTLLPRQSRTFTVIHPAKNGINPRAAQLTATAPRE